MDNFIFAVGYTFIIAIVAYYYCSIGRRIGIRATIEVMHVLEPEALLRMRPKLQELVDDTTNVK